MAPTPQEDHVEVNYDADRQSSERIVISGMSGLYPAAHNVKELADILYSKTNPVSRESCRYKYEHPEVPQSAGSVPELDKFDAQFFKVQYRLAITMDPTSRNVLEQTYHAIYDAGVCPESLSGKKISVFVGVTASEKEKSVFYKNNSKTGLGIVGCSRTMFANRISYWLNAKGPSIAVDAGCCSSLLALEMARRSIATGECEAAIVAGMKVNLYPITTANYTKVVPFSVDGKTKSFDNDATGPAVSEAVNVLFIQKAKDALRVYADVMHVKCEFDGFLEGDSGPRYGFYRKPEMLRDFMKCFYEEANVSPADVRYVEALGSAIPDVDKAELEAIAKVYCENRQDPLLVGSVMSNIGYTEAASGIAAVTKVLLGYHTGKLAANLHLDNERKDIACLREERIQLLKEHQPFHEGYAAVNGMSITGVNAHVLLKSSYKPKDLGIYKTDMPYLITLSGRQDSAVKRIIDELKSNPLDPEQLALLQNIHAMNISSHMGRGYTILATGSDKQTVCLSEQADYFDDVKRPLWFVYSGMGSQWAGMGTHLMRLPIFAAAIDKCRRVLEPKGVDIVEIITSQDKAIFANILNSFVGIAAIQIGLTDILHDLGLHPDNIIGHSVGELGCAYADGCMTAEEMILSAYYRGLVSLQTPFIRGTMAAVGIGYQQVINLCPPDIEVACHNSAESCTISGPADSIKAFAQKLNSEGIFVKEVPSSNIAYHSRYIAEAGPGLLKYLKNVIKCPKLRSERWISTSVPREKWNSIGAKYSSAEYHTNNLLSPVLFEESSVLVPANAVLVEVAPHGLLQAILKRALPAACTNIPLTLRGNNNLQFLLEAIGKIYMVGFVPKVSVLYPKIDFPVSTGTPMLSHLVEWAHEEIWPLPTYNIANVTQAAACKFVISIHDDEYSYLRGHIIRENILYPFAAVLMDVWDTLCMSLKQPKKQLSVQFRNVKFYSQPILHDRRQLRLSVALHRVSGMFEVTDDVTKVATGFIEHGNDEESLERKGDYNEHFNVTSEDIYEMAFNRDYCYRGDFRSIHSATSSMSAARVLWRGNWVTFLDGILQINALRRKHSTVSQLEFVRRIKINVPEHVKDNIVKLNNENVMVARVFEEDYCISCGGVELESIQYRDLMPLNRGPISLEALKFTGPSMQTLKEGAGNEEYVPLQERTASECNVQLQCGSVGRPHSLQWVEARPPAGDGVDVTVHFAGLNYTDYERSIRPQACSEKEAENIFGVEFSGKLSSGLRVMGLAPDGAVRARLRARPELLWPVPAHWTLEDAATVPLAYCFAYYCLVERFQLLPGMRIFVENGVSAFGQAVIALAVANNCEVFTTTRTVSEKRHLLSLFPQLKHDHICGTRDYEFADMILSITEGKGCNLVITSIRGGLMMDTLKCVADFGSTIVIGGGQECEFGMYYLFQSRNVVFMNFSRILQENNKELMTRLQRLVSAGVCGGAVRPLSRVTLPARRAPAAARCLPDRRRAGCLLLNMRDAPLNKRRLLCSPDKLQFIACANEALGLVLAEKLVQAGARKFHIHSQNTFKYIKNNLRFSLKQDIEVNISSEDLREVNNVHNLLDTCNKVAPVESIHIVMFDESSKQSGDDVNSTIHNLDVESRKLCPHLKYFTILNHVNVGQNICISRKQNNFPATMVIFSGLNNDTSTNAVSRQVLTRWEAVNALEKAIFSGEAVVLAKKQAAAKRSILLEIADVSNISIPEDVEPGTSLAALGLPAAAARTVAAHLQDAHNVTLSEQETRDLTINKLREIEEILLNCEFKETKPLETFFSYIEPDELVGTLNMLFPPTLFNKIESNEIAMEQQHLVIVPGMEGCHLRFRQLCERLQLPALVLQPSLERPWDSPAQLARTYVQTLLKKLRLKGQFYIMGYETGVAVSLEMVSLLEEHGLTGTVFCLGGEPQAIRAAVVGVVTSFGTEEALQDAVLRHMMQLMTDKNNINTKALDIQLREELTWESKVDACVRLLLGSVPHSAQYARQVIQNAYVRLQQARKFEITPRAFRSQIVAMLPASHPLDVSELQQFSRQPVQLYQLRAPLGRAADDLRCAAIVNQHLSSDIRKEFEMKDRCENYNVIGDSVTTESGV
ncbi:fatty acid synthase-like [Epargyreus clarus]|uniref:fatty acid synthase-like n=1 Tax=Epargyreus clarus TaxID=520877 RepID=UPI003C2EC75F